MSRRVNKSVDIDIEIFTFLLSYVVKKGLEKDFNPQDFLTRLVNIFQKPAVLDVFFLLLQLKASTVNLLDQELPDLSWRTIYRAIHFLEDLGWVVKTRPVKTDGRPAAMFALRDYSPDDLVRAFERERHARTPVYEEVKRIVQVILDDVIPELQLKGYKDLYSTEVYNVIKRSQRGFRAEDLYPLVLEKLGEMRVPLVHSRRARI